MTLKPSDMMFTEHSRGFLTSASGSLPTVSMEVLAAEYHTKVHCEETMEASRKGEKPKRVWKASHRRKKKARKRDRVGAGENKWVLWTNVDDESALHHPDGSKVTAKEYNRNLRKVGVVHSREELWELWNASYVRNRFLEREDVCFGLFRSGIAPTWEDSSNEKGGSLGMSFKQLTTAENVWLSVLVTLTMVHCDESIHYNEINGHVFKSRPWGYSVAVWNRYSHNKRFKGYLQNYLESELAVPQQWMTYKAHRSKRKPLPLHRFPSQEERAKLSDSNQNAGLEGTAAEASFPRPGHSRSDSLTVIQEEEPDDLHHSNSACEFEPLRKTTPFDSLDSPLFSNSSDEESSSADDENCWERQDECMAHSSDLQLMWSDEQPPVPTRRVLGKPDRKRVQPSQDITFLTVAVGAVLALLLTSLLGQLLL